MTELDFSGKTVLVVGGSSGIGNGIAQSFHARGAAVHVWGTRASAEDYKDESGSDLTGLHYAQMNVGDYDALTNFSPPFKTLDVLILCQGIVRYGRKEFEKPDWDDVMAVNIDSVMSVAQKFKPMLSDAKGAIIIVSSISGYRANVGNPAYAASKAAAISLTKTLGAAWARNNIRVNGIAPGLVHTKLTAVTVEHDQRREAALKAIPQRRIGTPEDMAGVALFLASPLSSYVLGQTIIVDGGLTLS